MAGPLRFNMNFLPEDKRSAEVNGFLSMPPEGRAQGPGGPSLPPATGWWATPLTCADISCAGYLYYPNPSPSTAPTTRHRRLARPHRGDSRAGNTPTT
jgi:glutathione S-transferase